MSLLDDGQGMPQGQGEGEPQGNGGEPQGGAPAGDGQGNPAGVPPATVNLSTKLGEILSDDLKQDKTLERFRDRSLQEYIQDSLEMRKTMGGMVKVPPTDADWDTKQEYMYSVMDKLGMEKPPATAGEYQFDMSSLPAGQEQDPVMTEWARDAFHEARLTNQQANMLIKKWNMQAGDILAKSVEAQAKAYDNAVVALKKEWGEQFDTNKQTVAATANKIFPATLVKKFNDLGLGNDPEFLAAVLDINKRYMSEHNVNPGLGNNNYDGGGLTTTEKMRKILSDPNFQTDVSLQKEYSRLAQINAQTHNKVVR